MRSARGLRVNLFEETAVETALELLVHRGAAFVCVVREDGSEAKVTLHRLQESVRAGHGGNPLRTLVSTGRDDRLALTSTGFVLIDADDPRQVRLVPPDRAIWTSAHVTWTPPDGILRVLTREQEDVTQANIKEAFEAAHGLVAQADRGILVDIRGMRSMSRDARYFFKAREGGLGVALLAAPGPSLMIANFFMSLKRGPRTPTRMFVSEAAAVEWLQELRKKAEGRSETGS